MNLSHQFSLQMNNLLLSSQRLQKGNGLFICKATLLINVQFNPGIIFANFSPLTVRKFQYKTAFIYNISFYDLMANCQNKGHLLDFFGTAFLRNL